MLQKKTNSRLVFIEAFAATSTKHGFSHWFRYVLSEFALLDFNFQETKPEESAQIATRWLSNAMPAFAVTFGCPGCVLRKVPAPVVNAIPHAEAAAPQTSDCVMARVLRDATSCNKTVLLRGDVAAIRAPSPDMAILPI